MTPQSRLRLGLTAGQAQLTAAQLNRLLDGKDDDGDEERVEGWRRRSVRRGEESRSPLAAMPRCLLGEVKQVERQPTGLHDVDLAAGVVELAGAAGDGEEAVPLSDGASHFDRAAAVKQQRRLALER